MKKDDTAGIIGVVLLFGLPLYLFAAYWEYIVAAAGIAVAVYGVCLFSKLKQTESVMRSVDYAYIVGRTTCMATRSRPSGYSISSRGNVRAYWKYQKEVDHVEVEFEVHNLDGSVNHVTTVEGSSLYKKLSPYVRLKPEPTATQGWKPPVKEAPKPIEVPKIEAPVKTKEIPDPPQVAEPAKPSVQKAKEEK